MITLKNNSQIEILREGGQKLAMVLDKIAVKVRPNATGEYLNNFACDLIKKYGGQPSFLGYNGYPAAICISIDDVIVHGVPSNEKFEEGSIVGIDIGMYYRGLYTDAAITVPVGTISNKDKKLINVTKTCLKIAIKTAKPGVKVNEIGKTVQDYVQSNGFSVVRELVGHGVGLAVHEEPDIPNFSASRPNTVLEPGMVLAIEPMINAGKPNVIFENDGFTVRTKDGSHSAHFEHSIAITEKDNIILTALA